MRIAGLAEVKAKLSAFLREVGTTGPLVITRNGKAVAVLLAPIDDDDLERLLLSRSPRFRSLLSRSRESIRAGKGIAHREFWAASAQEVREGPESGKEPPKGRAAHRPPLRAGGRKSAASRSAGRQHGHRG